MTHFVAIGFLMMAAFVAGVLVDASVGHEEVEVRDVTDGGHLVTVHYGDAPVGADADMQAAFSATNNPVYVYKVDR